MSAQTILTLANGKGIDLLNPHWEDVDFDAYAEHLAKEKRYNGATPGVEYSVAEHLERGRREAMRHTNDALFAGYWSLHDAPEGVLKDDTTPKKRAIAELIELRCGILAPRILECFDELTDIHDAAIHEAAGLPWPMPEGIATLVKIWDRRMFVTEWRDLMRGVAHPDWATYESLKPFDSRITVPWDWRTAKRLLLDGWHETLPVFKPQRNVDRTGGPHPHTPLVTQNQTQD